MVVDDLVGVEGVDQLVGEGEERRVAHHLDRVEGEAEQADEARAARPVEASREVSR